MIKKEYIKHMVIAAGVTASVAFYIFGNGIEGKTKSEGIVFEKLTKEGAAGETGDPEGAENAKGTTGSENGSISLEEGFTDKQKQELEEIFSEALNSTLKEEVSSALREEMLKLGEEGYLERAKNEAESLMAREAEEKRGMVDINTAGVEELMKLEGIGEKRAADIISYRETIGGFNSIEELMNVSGIKEAVFNRIKDKIYV